MSEIWVSSDLHLGHANILNFKDKDGKRFRGDLFKDVDEMNEKIVYNHNQKVAPGDIWYCLGDVYFGDANKADSLISRLNGRKRLILGNHDNPKSQTLLKRFEKIMLWRNFPEKKILMTHVPIHESSFLESKKFDYNVHGHIHQNKSPSNNYINMSMENINYTPVNIDEIVKLHGKK